MSHLSSSSRHPLPPHVQRYSRDRNNSASSQSFPHSSTVSSGLPCYEDVNPTTSGRRSSENDMQRPFRRRKSFRTSSVRKKQNRARPEITIVSSQPMNHHPAFADGSKGSCVPPEAPPSYEEVIKESTPNNQRYQVESSIRSTPYPTVLAFASIDILSERTPQTRTNFDFSVDTSDTPNLPIPLTPTVLPSSGGNNNRESVSASNTSATIGRAASVSNVSSRFVTTYVPSEPKETLTTVSPASIKPAVPKKPNFSAKLPYQRSNIFERNNNSSMSTSSRVAAQAGGSDNAQPSRKLPPPPRPSTGPRVPLSHRTRSSAAATADQSQESENVNKPDSSFLADDVDDVSPYASVNHKNDSITSSIADTNIREYERNEELSHSAAPIQQSSEDKSTESTSLATKISDDFATNAVVNAEIEPMYAVVKKSSTPKPTNASRKSDKTVEDGHNFESPMKDFKPPPIPSSRPPIEDYNGIFDSPKPKSSVISNIVRDFTDDCGKHLNNKTKGNEDPYSTIDFKASNQRNTDSIATLPVGTDEVTAISCDSELSASIDPPYQSVFFKKESKGNCNTTHLKSDSLPPPLPPFPAVSKKEKSTLTKPKPAAKPKSVTNTKSDSQPKSFKSVRRTSLKFKQKLLKSKSSYEELDEPQDSNELKTVSRNAAELSRASGSTTAENHDYVKTVKRTPPPRPALPLVLQKKLQNTSSSEKTVATNSLSSNSDDNHSKTLPCGDNSITCNKPIPPKHPPLPPHLRALATPTQKPSSLVPNPVSSPMPKPRHNTSVSVAQDVPVSAASDKSADKSSVVSRTKTTSSKPSRPPPARKSFSSKNTYPSRFKKLSSSEDNRVDESFLNVVDENKNEPGKVPVDQAMKDNHSNEVSCVVTQSYLPETENCAHLSLVVGEKILVLKEIDDCLLFGRNKHGEEGMFPRIFVSSGVNSNSNNSNSAQATRPPVAKRRQTFKTTKPATELLGKATALYDYSSKNPDDLSFSAGFKIDIIGHAGSNWLKGRIGESEGLFPRNFVSFTPNENLSLEPNEKNEVSSKFVAALHNFNAEYDNELSFKAGDQLEILRRVDDEWLKAKLNDQTGIIPVAFVDTSKLDLPSFNESLSTATGFPICKKTADSSSNNNKFRSKIADRKALKTSRTAVALYDFMGENNSELSLQKNDVITITGEIDGDWLEGKVGERKGMFPANFVRVS